MPLPYRSYIDNGIIKVGVDIDRGTGIGYLSESGATYNFYGTLPDGDRAIAGLSLWGDNLTGVNNPGTIGEYPYNPISTSDEMDHGAIVESLVNNGTSIYSRITPVDWIVVFEEDPVVRSDMSIEQTVTLEGHVVKVHYKVTYSGPDRSQNCPVSDLGTDGWSQEMPFMAVASELRKFHGYIGAQGWSGQPLVNIDTEFVYRPGFNIIDPQLFPTAEPWAAFTGTDDVGIGLYLPVAQFIRAITWAVEQDHPPYLGGICYRGLNAGSVWEFDAYITIGHISDIRARFEAIHSTVTANHPVVSNFEMPASSDSLTVPITSLSVTNNQSPVEYLVTDNSVLPGLDSTGWSAEPPTEYTFSDVIYSAEMWATEPTVTQFTGGPRTAYAWVRDAEGNIGAAAMATVTIGLTPPSGITSTTLSGAPITSTTLGGSPITSTPLGG